jgi:hypothetical protein
MQNIEFKIRQTFNSFTLPLNVNVIVYKHIKLPILNQLLETIDIEISEPIKNKYEYAKYNL